MKILQEVDARRRVMARWSSANVLAAASAKVRLQSLQP
jgi:hypothetical protein